MIREIRLFVLLCRPAVLLLLALFTAIGASRGGAAGNWVELAAATLVVVAFLVFSVTVNDLSDVAIDQVNLPGDRRRPLVTGVARHRDMVLLALVCAAVAIGVAAAMNRAVLAVTVAGLATSAAYSLPPTRLAARGAVASLVLPAGYVATPFLVGVFAGRVSLRPMDLVLLAGLYVGFLGRILLKDFRDVRGDALFGKRTFLVRHGRRATCRLSAVMWTAGAVLVTVSAGSLVDGSAISYAASAVVVVILLAMLARDPGPHREQLIISATAILGRGLMLTVLAHDQAVQAGCSTLATAVLMLVLATMTAAQAWSMYRNGPLARPLTVPAEFQEVRDSASAGD